jgi:hypothetical protein
MASQILENKDDMLVVESSNKFEIINNQLWAATLFHEC